MNIDRKKLTPMMKQYLDTKDRYKDCILFYRLGDFYEMFFEDAIIASKTLEIALTGKSCGLEERAPMCGVPFHSADSYISKLVENGYKVAIGEQLEDPASAKGLVKRDVVRVVTPGTVLDGSLLENKKNNYLMSVYRIDDKVGISYVDISTGELEATITNIDKLIEETAKIKPSEIIMNDSELENLLYNIATISNIYLNTISEEKTHNEYDDSILSKYFSESYLEDIGINKNFLIKSSLVLLMNYIFDTQKQITSNICSINIYKSEEYMLLDMFTRTNLELTQTIRGGKKRGSLLDVLDNTRTSMGGRLLRKYIEQPLVNIEKIKNRLDIIDEIYSDYGTRSDLSESLKKIYDIERICGKIAFEKVTPKELINLKNSIAHLPDLKTIIYNSGCKKLLSYIGDMDTLSDIYTLIDSSIMEEPAITIKDGNIIKSEYNQELFDLRDISQNGAKIIKDIEIREREKTGVKSLKIGFNKVFGYYIDITKAGLAQGCIDDTYIRKQTLSNSERFITPELKEIEEKILNAEDKIKALEYKIFTDIRNQIYNNINRIQSIAQIVATIDVYVSMAETASINNYIKPNINTDNKLEIKNGRHPVVESIVGHENFVPNDTYLNNNENTINIITGPNMSGKSTYMRQTAVIVLMAHIGSFVPAEYADIPITDRIFTRVGASDDLAQGQSTFMIEMNEVSLILNNATADSLVILDEVGRGTSTYDGISLAWSIVEYIHEKIKCKTLFATHYHELTDLEDEFESVKNYSIDVKDNGKDIVFLRKIVPHAADKSYGIYVAKLADIPEEVIKRSSEILSDLEKNHVNNMKTLTSGVKKEDVNENKISIDEKSINSNFDEYRKKYEQAKENIKTLEAKNKKLKKEIIALKEAPTEMQLSFAQIGNELEDAVLSLDLMNMTPLDAMSSILELQKIARKNK
ncbi:DNA mismatch repair protein MutS [Peptacetobacter hominis]|uniref:DNA mismatch repair protein MutS n=1 Tax=Peptacetobacter hominis TaxID=2743610 RepID=A0A544QVJ3_9FIRM|nr:DNA mismatch repair protein MutS [Peptacetobacter hominis]TQQ84713.1 DNA mismatch repair protein MutS [Peptacetobacter hominis]